MPQIFKLRPWLASDSESLLQVANNRNIAKFMADTFPHPYNEEHANKFIAFANKDEPIHIFAIDVDGKAVGGIGVHPQEGIQQKNAELGYWLGEEYWGKGIATAAVKEMILFAFKTYNIDRLFGRTFGNNPASQKVLEKAGFIFEARFEKTFFKFGEYQDELVYAIRRKQLMNLK